MHLKYDNITISGGVAVGTTTLMENLRPYLEPRGWKLISTGNIVREYMKENIMPIASLVSDEYDRAIEKKALDMLKNGKHWVIEAWLAGFVARNLPKTCRILLTCSHNSLRVDRVVNRDKVSIIDAKRFIKEREEGNFHKWKKIYGDYNFFDPKYYTFVIDTYSFGQLETMRKTLDAIGYV